MHGSLLPAGLPRNVVLKLAMKGPGKYNLNHILQPTTNPGLASVCSASPLPREHVTEGTGVCVMTLCEAGYKIKLHPATAYEPLNAV